MIRSFAVATMVCLGLVQVSQAQDGRGATAFGQLKSLAGDWEGTYEWTGTGAGGSMTATYSLSGNGSAVVETLTMGGVPGMTSVYHLDGADLRMTHFCAAQNQPRLKAHRIPTFARPMPHTCTPWRCASSIRATSRSRSSFRAAVRRVANGSCSSETPAPANVGARRLQPSALDVKSIEQDAHG